MHASPTMRKILVGLGLVGLGVIAYRLVQRYRSRALEDLEHRTPGMANPEVATRMGISDVDPQPMTQISGEGIDRDANQDAHSALPDQRAKLPRDI